MDKFTLEKMERKFDICYLLAKEGMAFKKYPAQKKMPTKLRTRQGYLLLTLHSIRGIVLWLFGVRLTFSAF